MMHSQTSSNVKDHILQQFSQTDGHLRILVATIVFGMGVNCKGVQRVIHFGPSKTIEAYIQESGRCGREGEESYAILLYNAIMIRAADDGMKDYINGEHACRRKALLKHFDGDISSKPSGHLCCDRCAEKCTCKRNKCDTYLYLPVGQLQNDMNVTVKQRDVSDNQIEQLRKKLWQMQKTIILREGSRATNHVTYPTTLMQFGEHQIKQVLENCNKIFTLEDVMHHVDIWNKQHSISILWIIKDLFKDIEMVTVQDSSSDSESDDEMHVDYVLWNGMFNDKSFLSLLNDSEWNADSSVSLCNDTCVDNIPGCVNTEDMDYVPDIVSNIFSSI